MADKTPKQSADRWNEHHTNAERRAGVWTVNAVEPIVADAD
jgi:hypothetical protein